MTNEDLHAIFFAECDESLALAEAGLTEFGQGDGQPETVNGVFRAVHSVKGGAGAFGFSSLQTFAHHFETVLSEVRDGRAALDGDLLDLMLRAFDLLTDHVEAARNGTPAPDDGRVIARMEEVMAQLSRPPAAPAAPGGEPRKPNAAAPDRPESGKTEAGEPRDDEDRVPDASELGAFLDDIIGDLGSAEAPELASASASEGRAPAAEDWYQLSLRPYREAMTGGSEPLLLLRELARLGGEVLACDTTALPPLDSLDPSEAYLAWTIAMPAAAAEEDVREIFEFLGDDIALAFGSEQLAPQRARDPVIPLASESDSGASGCDDPAPKAGADKLTENASAPVAAPVPAAAAAISAPVQTIRIDLRKLDRLIDSVGELTIAQAMLAQRLSDQKDGTTEELALLETLTRDIQESAMAIRAQPIGTVFSRVPRILRDLAAETGKHVKLETQGEATELDKTVIERLGEPLTHLIRNAVDHGIEAPEERLAKGKLAEGTIRLSAEQRSGRIVISISDDGAGINREKVLEKAISQGIVDGNAELTAEEIENLIFAPGFSTAAALSNVSGRGVGMDVVRQNVKDLGGRIMIENRVGQGTTFSLALPLTLAIAEGMIVRIGEETYVVPLVNVVESLSPRPDMVKGIGTGRQVLDVRGRYLPIVEFEGARADRDSPPRAPGGVMIVVESESFGQAALLVDEIRDQRQVVIKSVEHNLGAVEGVSGATILGNGRVALILDIDAIVTRPAERGFLPAEAA